VTSRIIPSVAGGRMSLAARISLLAACAVGFAVAAAALAAYITLRSQLYTRLDDSLLERATAAAQPGVTSEADVQNLPEEFLGAADLRVYLLYASGNIRPANHAYLDPVTTDEAAVAAGTLDHSLRTVERRGHELRVATVQQGPGIALMFVQSTEPIERTLDRMGLVLLLVGGGGIIAAALTGLAVARSSLMPVRRLSAAADYIARTEELHPIEVTGDDELASLATSFNKMLAALSASRERQRRLVIDAGHELRTPLTSLRTNLELLAQADRQGGMTSAQRDEIFSDATAQVEELSTLVGDLVELAREEPVSVTPEPVDFADIVARAVERVRRRAPDVTFDVSTRSWWVVGEVTILERAVTNLLDNAAKYGPSDGVVTVRLADGLLSVADQGPGIGEHDLPMIFERFYRAEGARTMPGSGLGLSIVRQAAERHGGHVAVANRDPAGSTFTMWLPGQAQEISPVRTDREAAAKPERAVGALDRSERPRA
jgi:two-component system, OmpR family, sensor histidine kinase MprB